MTAEQLDEVLSLLLIYLPTAPCRQLLGDLDRSRAAGADPALRSLVRRLATRLDERPLTYRKEKPQ